MWIKICANTNLADAQLAAELGADAVGFVFAPSKRRVSPEEVAEITPHLPGSVEKVGVFAPGDEDLLAEALAISGLTAVQLHGDFVDWKLDGVIDDLAGRVKLIQVVGYDADHEDARAAREIFEERLVEAVRHPAVWGVLLDAKKAGNSGGLGVTFDWAEAKSVVDWVFERLADPPRLIVAGGLNPINVGEAVRTFAPFGVDVASGVEARPGVKDPAKLREFLVAARRG